ncbi:MAG TPA: thiamine pyrophosphate-dependent enzyme [Anaerolineae bacterium]|nr:thiamine pyrophosphate-dependent enzyme [Anaerolineae bacterium]
MTEEADLVFDRPASLSPVVTHYCPGCIHGITHRLIAEVMDELGIRERTVGIAPVGCSVLAYNYFECDFAEAAHGRAPAMATGIKRTNPDLIVFTYQGDGDLASIGTNELIHAAARGENITTVFINNAVYGMTGGQMAPTTLPGMVTTSSPYGRDVKTQGFPVRVCELIAQLDGAAYVVRRTAFKPLEVRRLRAALKTAFQVQMAGLGFSLVEVVSNCPTNWGMTPRESISFVEQQMIGYYPLGDYKTREEVKSLR